jgi:hypothetical protein
MKFHRILLVSYSCDVLCFWCFQKLTAKFWFHSNRFKISKFQTCWWCNLKKVNIAVTYLAHSLNLSLFLPSRCVLSLWYTVGLSVFWTATLCCYISLCYCAFVFLSRYLSLCLFITHSVYLSVYSSFLFHCPSTVTFLLSFNLSV